MRRALVWLNLYGREAVRQRDFLGTLEVHKSPLKVYQALAKNAFGPYLPSLLFILDSDKFDFDSNFIFFICLACDIFQSRKEGAIT